MNSEMATSRGLRHRAFQWILLRLCREFRIQDLDTHFLVSNVVARDKDMLDLTPEIIWDELQFWAHASWSTLQRVAVRVWMLCLFPLMCILPKVLRLRFREWQQNLDRNDIGELIRTTASLVAGNIDPRSPVEGAPVSRTVNIEHMDDVGTRVVHGRMIWMSPKDWRETLEDLADMAEWNSWVEGEKGEGEWFAKWEGAREVPACLDKS